jgi:hypothetical protein
MLRADHECGVFLEGGNFERLVASTADHGSTHV